MILQNDALWLGEDGIGENLIPNQGPVSARRTLHLSSACWSLDTKWRCTLIERVSLEPSPCHLAGTMCHRTLRSRARGEPPGSYSFVTHPNFSQLIGSLI